LPFGLVGESTFPLDSLKRPNRVEDVEGLGFLAARARRRGCGRAVRENLVSLSFRRRWKDRNRREDEVA
jgi:hypothetical protein